MSKFQFSLDPEKLRARKYPPWLVKTILIVSVLPFLSFGAFMAGRILRISGGKNNKLVIPFILFVLLFCAVPVIQVFFALRKMKKIPAAGIITAQPAEPGPTAALQMPIEEIQRHEHSKIQIRDAPDGREFFFPATRNPGTAFVITALMLFWSATVWGLFYTKAPLLVPIVLGVAGVFIVLGCLNLWFKQSRVTIHAKGVRAAKHWLIFGRTRLFDTGEVARFDSKDGMRRGRQVYHDIQLITRTEEKITVATGIASKTETDGLVQEMNKALGRAAEPLV